MAINETPRLKIHFGQKVKKKFFPSDRCSFSLKRWGYQAVMISADMHTNKAICHLCQYDRKAALLRF